jgi:hypothetical protein
MIPFPEYCQKVAGHIETRYGIRVITRDVADPLVGDLNGTEIHIDYAVTPEQRLFLLAHLFGHTVQWNSQPDTVELGRPRQPPVPASMLPALMDYELAASEYAVTMFHDVGILDLDQWLSNSSECDMEYLRHYYITGEKKRPEAFWRENAPRLKPRPIPSFKPTKHASRSDGIVI